MPTTWYTHFTKGITAPDHWVVKNDRGDRVATVWTNEADAVAIREVPAVLTFLRDLASRTGLHVIRLDGLGTHAPECPPCRAQTILERIRQVPA